MKVMPNSGGKMRVLFAAALVASASAVSCNVGVVGSGVMNETDCDALASVTINGCSKSTTAVTGSDVVTLSCGTNGADGCTTVGSGAASATTCLCTGALCYSADGSAATSGESTPADGSDGTPTTTTAAPQLTCWSAGADDLASVWAEPWENRKISNGGEFGGGEANGGCSADQTAADGSCNRVGKSKMCGAEDDGIEWECEKIKYNYRKGRDYQTSYYSACVVKDATRTLDAEGCVETSVADVATPNVLTNITKESCYCATADCFNPNESSASTAATLVAFLVGFAALM